MSQPPTIERWDDGYHATLRFANGVEKRVSPDAAGHWVCVVDWHVYSDTGVLLWSPEMEKRNQRLYEKGSERDGNTFYEGE